MSKGVIGKILITNKERKGKQLKIKREREREGGNAKIL